MPFLDRDGLRLNYEQRGHGDPPFVFIHGWCCDNTFFELQIEHFGRSHALTLVDLRGHGMSDRPEHGYEIHDFADDIAWMCRELGLERPILIGHSLGGMIAIEIAARHPSLPAAVVALDPGPINITRQDRQRYEAVVANLPGPDGEAVRDRFLTSMFAPTDDQERAERLKQLMCEMPIHLAAEILRAATTWNGVGALRLCNAPSLVVLGTAVGGRNDPARLLSIKPDLVIGVTVGAGHFIELDAANQVNAMIESFLKTWAD